MKLIKKNKLQIASIIILLIIFLVLSFQTYNKANRPDGYDFKSYLISSKALWEGSNPYVTGSSFPYIYPLFLTVLLIPLTQISYNISVYIWFIINVVSLIYSIDYLFRNCDKYNRSLFYGIPLLLLFLLTLNILQNNFLNGQVNILVLFFSVLYFYFFSKDKLIIASFFLSAAIAIKLVPLIFLLLVFRKEKISVLFYTAIISSVFIFLLPFVFTGSNLFEYYKYYLDNFLSKSLNNTTGSHDMFYTLNGFLNYILPSLTGFTWIKYISALFIVLLVMSIDYRWVKNNFKVFGIHIFSLYAICILFISPMSETHHLVFILPGLSLILYELIIKKRVKELYLLISFIFFIVLFWTGEITRSVPFHFTALIILFTIISLEIKKKNLDDNIANKI